ncbi:MAG TPA: YggS family pyridoxal phosphate-dependent enzyme [Pyrinomonadaceae bacterium]|nr:YggS family pyridoxal phosphate-dependent enzyme [Pyrinomonadaceae bacterium]
MTSEAVPQNRTLRERFEDVRRRIDQAAERAGRASTDVRLIAISKTHPTSVLREGLTAGVTDFGENRVQEASPKIEELGRDAARWHLVGHLQTNKASRAVKLFDYIHSLDSVELAQKLERLCETQERNQLSVLIQIDFGKEETKTGLDPKKLPELLATIKECKHLQLAGLMTLPPYFENPDCARPFFKTLRQLRDELKAKGNFGDDRGELSMGMSHDFEIAIEEGATMVRVGTAIFGERGK